MSGCCNPAHLFLGTPKENSEDCKRKGRTNGGRTPGSSYNHEDVAKMLAEGLTRKEIAERTGMSDRNVYYIQRKLALATTAPDAQVDAMALTDGGLCG